MCLVVNLERRWQNEQAAAAQCRNTSHRRKRRVNYEKISLPIVIIMFIIICLQSFHDNTELIMNSSFPFAKLPRCPL